MSDLYSEVLVKCRKTARDRLVKAGAIAGTVLVLAAGIFWQPLLLPVGVILCVACYFFLPRLDLEYEYLFVNGELDVDVIMGQAKRKRVRSCQMETVEIMAPISSHRLDYYRNNSRMKTFDYSSGSEENKRYMMIVKDGEAGICKVILEPGEELANTMKKSAPTKVFLD